MKKQFLYPLVTCSIALAGNVALADVDLFEMSLAELLEVRLSTASGFEQKINKSPASLTVYYPWQWQAMGIERLDQLLETIPGFHVTQSQISLNMDVYGVRGLQSGFNDKINLMIDGTVIRGANGGSTNFGYKKSLAGIKRIEIMKGPGSVVYGADAFSGVINLITNEADNSLAPQLNLRAGSFDSFSFDISNSVKVGSGQLDVAFSYMHNNDDDDRTVSSDLQTVIDQIFLTSASRAPGVINDRNEVADLLLNYNLDDLSITYWGWHNDDSGVGTGAAQVLDPEGNTKTTYNLLSVDQKFDNVMGGELDWSVSFQQYDGQSHYIIFPAGSVLPIGADGNVDFATPVGFTLFTDGYIGDPGSIVDIWRTSFTHVAEINSKLTLRSEIGLESQSATTNEQKNFGPGILDGTELVVDGTLMDVTGTPLIYRQNTSRRNKHLSFQAEWQLSEQWSFNMGARFDDYSDFGSTFNPRGGLIWSTDTWTTKLIYGNAFRAPTASELFFKNNPSATGNPNLTEENIDNIDWVIEWQPKENWIVSLNLFSYDAEDLIEFVLDPLTNQKTAQNIGGQRGDGGELQFTAQLSESLRWTAYYAWVDIDFDDPGRSIDYPGKQSYVSLDWQVNDDWTVHGRYKRIADRERGVGDPRGALPDYNLASVKFSYHGISDKTTLTFIINNALDDNGTEPSSAVIPEDFPIHGRQFVLELEQRF